MTMFTRNCPDMNKKMIPNIFYSTIILFNLLLTPVYSNPVLVVNANNSTGKWSKGVITGREAVSANKPLINSEVQVYIENPGKYQLFSYVHHNYRETIPCIYAEVYNDKGVLYRGSHRIENIWYLDKDSPGRWFMVSLTQDPYWELPGGNLTIRFWADAVKSIWNNDKASMEGVISIDKFFLIPIQESGKNLSLPWLIYPETGNGAWDISDYHSGYATNLAESSKNAQRLTIPVDIVYPDYFRLWGSVFSSLDNSLEMTIRGNKGERKMEVLIKGSDSWSFISSDLIYLDQGEYEITLEHTNSNPVLIDYLMLLSDKDHQR